MRFNVSGHGTLLAQYIQNVSNIKQLTVNHLNMHPQSLGTTEKLLIQFTSFFGCFLICVLVSPSGVCYLNYAPPLTFSRDCINLSQVAADTGAVVASLLVTGTQDTMWKEILGLY